MYTLMLSCHIVLPVIILSMEKITFEFPIISIYSSLCFFPLLTSLINVCLENRVQQILGNSEPYLLEQHTLATIVTVEYLYICGKKALNATSTLLMCRCRHIETLRQIIMMQSCVHDYVCDKSVVLKGSTEVYMLTVFQMKRLRIWIYKHGYPRTMLIYKAILQTIARSVYK